MNMDQKLAAAAESSRLGLEAGQRGDDPRTCPYEKMTAEWHNWQTWHGWAVEMAGRLKSMTMPSAAQIKAAQCAVMKEALEQIANGEGYYGAQAREYKQIARAALSNAERVVHDLTRHHN